LSTIPNPVVDGKDYRIDPDSALMKILRDEYGIKDPGVLFVYGAGDVAGTVARSTLYIADSDMRVADLQGPVVMNNTRTRPDPGEVIKVQYVTGQSQVCTYVNGVPIWIP
jgi:hypothetical protein